MTLTGKNTKTNKNLSKKNFNAEIMLLAVALIIAVIATIQPAAAISEGTWLLTDPIYENTIAAIELYEDGIGNVPSTDANIPAELKNLSGNAYYVDSLSLPYDRAVEVNTYGNSWIVFWNSQRTAQNDTSLFSLVLKVDSELGRAVNTTGNDGSKYEILRDLSDERVDFRDMYDSIADLSDNNLKYELNKLVKNQVVLGYTGARKKMFGDIYNKNGYVECIYTDMVMRTNSIPNHQVMNCEHSWPQSQFMSGDLMDISRTQNDKEDYDEVNSNRDGVKKCDLNHLFPTDSKANSRRSSWPFGIVQSVKWSKDGCKLGYDANGRTVFEPEPEHKGNIARALFYFSVRYNMNLASFQEDVLRQWHKEDPVNDKDMKINDGIFRAQKNRNPFVDRPEFVDQISNF